MKQILTKDDHDKPIYRVPWKLEIFDYRLQLGLTPRDDVGLTFGGVVHCTMKLMAMLGLGVLLL